MSDIYVLHQPGCRSDRDGVGCTCRPKATKDAREALAWERTGRLHDDDARAEERETPLARRLRTGVW